MLIIEGTMCTYFCVRGAVLCGFQTGKVDGSKGWRIPQTSKWNSHFSDYVSYSPADTGGDYPYTSSVDEKIDQAIG